MSELIQTASKLSTEIVHLTAEQAAFIMWEAIPRLTKTQRESLMCQGILGKIERAFADCNLNNRGEAHETLL